MPLERITILGVGLLGGSIGLALKSNSSNYCITGYGHRPETLERAQAFGAIDQGVTNLPSSVRDADLVIVCTPVGLFESMLRGITNDLKPSALVTDVGSTKRSIVRLGESLLPKGVGFVGSHPMAGSEKRGVEFARTDLFQNALCITTPTPATDPQALEQIEGFWRGIGMRLTRTSPEEHDRLLAEVSHLPHAIAAALVSMQTDPGLQLSGKGFLDATRIAGGDGALWRDILLDNRDNVRLAIDTLVGRLRELDALLEPGQADALAKWLDAAARRRSDLVRQKLGEIEP